MSKCLILFDSDGCTAVVQTINVDKDARKGERYKYMYRRKTYQVEVLERNDSEVVLDRFERAWQSSDRASVIAKRKERSGKNEGGYLECLPTQHQQLVNDCDGKVLPALSFTTKTSTRQSSKRKIKDDNNDKNSKKKMNAISMPGQEKHFSKVEGFAFYNQEVGLHNEDKAKGLHNEGTTKGLPDEDKTEGLPDEDETEDLPDEDETEGLPDEDETEDLPDEDETEDLPDEDKTEGLPDEDETEGLPDEDETEDLPDEDETEDLPDKDETEDLPDEDKTEGLPDEDETEDLPDEDETEDLPDENKTEDLHIEDETEGLHFENGINSSLQNISAIVKTLFSNGFEEMKQDLKETIQKSMDEKIKTFVLSQDKNQGDLTNVRKSAEDELKSARKTHLINLTGPHTTLCFDVSDSMKQNEAWEQAKMFYGGYISGTMEEYTRNRNNGNTAIVTFGHDTKVQHHLTKDLKALKHSIENITLGGPSPLLAGLILANASVTVSNYRDAIVNSIRVPPRIIVVTDGKVTAVNEENELYDQDQNENSIEVNELIIKEVSSIKKKGIDLHFVYVGKPDIAFLHKLSEISGGELMPHTSGRIFAKDIFFKIVLKNDQEFLQHVVLQNQKKSRRGVYNEHQDMQKYAPIGTRVRRGLDWTWGNQDKGGPGTIIGHSYDEMKKYWCWVEWDANVEINLYRWDINGKCDLTMVDEERIPADGKIFAVGSRVKPGKCYKGEQTNREGVVIQMIDEKKVQVRWKDDGTREELSFGDDIASCEAEPLPIYKSGETALTSQISNSEGLMEKANFEPPAPKDIEVYDVYEHTACLKWQKSSEDADFSNSKYVVTYGETKNPQKRTLLEITATLSCTLDDLKSGSEYTAEVKLVDGKRESLPARSNSFTTMETDKDDMRYADRILTERDAARLTSAIGANWELLATELGVSTIPLHRIKQDNQTSTSIIYHMLLHWVTNDSKPTFVRFIKALEKCPEVSIDRKVINSMKEEFKMIDMETNAYPQK